MGGMTEFDDLPAEIDYLYLFISGSATMSEPSTVYLNGVIDLVPKVLHQQTCLPNSGQVVTLNFSEPIKKLKFYASNTASVNIISSSSAEVII